MNFVTHQRKTKIMDGTADERYKIYLYLYTATVPTDQPDVDGQPVGVASVFLSPAINLPCESLPLSTTLSLSLSLFRSHLQHQQDLPQ